MPHRQPSEKINLKTVARFWPHFKDIFLSTFTTHFTTFYHAKNHVRHLVFSKNPVKTPLSGRKISPRFFRIKRRFGRGHSEQKHAVAITEKAVLLLDGVRISGKHCVLSSLLSRERADQHKQRRLRQMEVGQKTADDSEMISRADKNTGLPRVRF
jgi:hypothetical protein